MPTPMSHPPETRRAVLRLISEGMTTLQAGAAYGVGQSTVSVWARQVNVGRRRPKISKTQCEQVQKRLRAGDRICDVTDALGLSRKTVRAIRNAMLDSGHMPTIQDLLKRQKELDAPRDAVLAAVRDGVTTFRDLIKTTKLDEHAVDQHLRALKRRRLVEFKQGAGWRPVIQEKGNPWPR